MGGEYDTDEDVDEEALHSDEQTIAAPALRAESGASVAGGGSLTAEEAALEGLHWQEAGGDHSWSLLLLEEKQSDV